MTDEVIMFSNREYTELLQKADETIIELETKLNGVSIKVGASSTKVIEAVKAVFGPSYIKQDGSTELTFEMYKKVSEALREIGKLKVQEYL